MLMFYFAVNLMLTHMNFDSSKSRQLQLLEADHRQVQAWPDLQLLKLSKPQSMPFPMLPVLAWAMKNLQQEPTNQY